MPLYAITAQIDVDEPDVAALCDVLQCKPNALQATLEAYAPAAIQEYVDMFLGVGSITTATDTRERRLVGLMRTVFAANGLPSAEQVSRLFNITPGAAGSLLKAVTAKHRLALKQQMDAALKGVVDAFHRDGNAGPYTVTISDPLLVGLLNARLRTSPVPKTPLRLAGDTPSKYTVDPGSRDFLREQFP